MATTSTLESSSEKADRRSSSATAMPGRRRNPYGRREGREIRRLSLRSGTPSVTGHEESTLHWSSFKSVILMASHFSTCSTAALSLSKICDAFCDLSFKSIVGYSCRRQACVSAISSIWSKVKGLDLSLTHQSLGLRRYQLSRIGQSVRRLRFFLWVAHNSTQRCSAALVDTYARVWRWVCIKLSRI